jgi:hypothetical protein
MTAPSNLTLFTFGDGVKQERSGMLRRIDVAFWRAPLLVRQACAAPFAAAAAVYELWEYRHEAEHAWRETMAVVARRPER